MYYRDQLKGKLSGKQQHKQNLANQTEAFFTELCKWMWLEKFKTVAFFSPCSLLLILPRGKEVELWWLTLHFFYNIYYRQGPMKYSGVVCV